MSANCNKIAGQSVEKDLFCLLVSSVKDYAIFMVDTDGGIMSWNEGAERITGYNEHQAIGMHVTDFYPPDVAAATEESYHLSQALKHGKYQTESWLVKKDGCRFWADVDYTPVYNDGQHLIGFAKVVRDVTARKLNADRQEIIQSRLSQKLKQSSEKMIANELRFSKLIAHSYDGLSLLDKHFRVIYRSLSAERINGWNNEERAKTDMMDLIHPEDVIKIAEFLPLVLAQPMQPHFITFRSLHQQGNYIWLECLFTNMLADEAINAIVCNFRDITQRINDEADINRKAAQIENILERITDGFVALDNDLRYTYANKKIGEMLGCTPESLIGRNVWDVFPQAVGSKTYNAIIRAHKYQIHVHNEDFYEPLHLWQENDIYPSAEGLSIFIRDISDRKISENQVISQHMELKEAAKIQNAVLNALPPHITLLDENGIILNVNDAWKRFSLANKLHVPDFGIGSSYYSICDKIVGTGKESQRIAKGIKSVLAGKRKEYVREYSCHTPTQKRWFQLVAAPLADEKQKGVVVLHINNTKQKLAEESLLKSQANLRSVFENTDQSVVLFDNDLKIVAYNGNARELSVRYFKRRMRVGSSAFKYFPKDRKPEISAATTQAKAGHVVCYEVRYDFPGLPKKWFEVKWVSINDRRKKTVGVILTIKDITDRKQQQNEINRQNEALREAAWISSHEIRRPVASILGLINLFKSTPEKTEHEELIELIDSCAHELDEMVHQIHDKIKDGDSMID